MNDSRYASAERRPHSELVLPQRNVEWEYLIEAPSRDDQRKNAEERENERTQPPGSQMWLDVSLKRVHVHEAHEPGYAARFGV